MSGTGGHWRLVHASRVVWCNEKLKTEPYGLGVSWTCGERAG